MRGIVTEIRMSVISLKGRVLLKTLRALSLRTKGFVLRRRNLAAACGKHQHHIVSLSTLAPPKCKKKPSEYQIRNHLFELNITIIISSFFQSCVWYKSLWYSLFAITSIMIWPVLDLYQFTEYWFHLLPEKTITVMKTICYVCLWNLKHQYISETRMLAYY